MWIELGEKMMMTIEGAGLNWLIGAMVFICALSFLASYWITLSERRKGK